MENITLISILSENFPLILSSVVSIFSIVVNVFVVLKQTSSERKTKAMDLYFKAQYEAYKELYEAAIELEIGLKSGEPQDIKRLFSTVKSAEILSPGAVVTIIDDFCRIYTLYFEKKNSGEQVSPKLENALKEVISTLGYVLSKELMRFNEKESESLKWLEKKFQKHSEQ